MNVLKIGLPLAWVALCGLTTPAAADDNAPGKKITFYKDVAPILQESCQVCHRPSGPNLSGMVAPMSLIKYEEVRPWAKSIAKEVKARNMPPWFASREFDGVFEHQRTLSDAQIETIIRWVATGAARGNPADAPEPRIFNSTEGWTMGEPDIIIKMPEPYWVADEVEDIQPRFELILTEEMLPEDRWVNWIEFRPGSEIVHHGGARVTPLDENGEPMIDPISGGKLIGTAPGDGPDVWPLGYGKLIRKGSRISFGLHYHKEAGPGTGAWDQSMIAIKWHDTPVKHVVRAAGISSRGWEIPPRHPNWQVGASRLLEQDTHIINFMPHMHFRGKAAKYEAFYPDGTSEVLLDVPVYSYTWQMTYTYKEPKFVPAGTRIESTMWFDNSPENELVPNPDNPRPFGPETNDEMNIGWMEYANADPIEDLAAADFGTQGTGVEDIDEERFD